MGYNLESLKELYRSADEFLGLSKDDVNEMINSELEEFLKLMPTVFKFEELPTADLLAMYVLCKAGSQRKKELRPKRVAKVYDKHIVANWLISDEWKHNNFTKYYYKEYECLNVEIQAMIYLYDNAGRLEVKVGGGSSYEIIPVNILANYDKQLDNWLQVNLLHLAGKCASDCLLGDATAIVQIAEYGFHMKNRWYFTKEEVRGKFKVKLNLIMPEEQLDVSVKLGMNKLAYTYHLHDYNEYPHMIQDKVERCISKLCEKLKEQGSDY